MLIVGETVIEGPVPIEEDKVSVYHIQLAPVPRDPPLAVNTDDPPAQSEVGTAKMEDAGVEAVLEEIVPL